MLRELGALAGVGRSLTNQGLVLDSSGMHDEALESFDEAVRVVEPIGDAEVLPVALRGIARLLWIKGESEKALDIIGRAEAICRRTGDDQTLCEVLEVKGALYYGAERFNSVLDINCEIEQLARNSDSNQKLQLAIGNTALVLARLGHWEEAMAKFREQERICRATGNLNWLGWGLGNKADELQKRGLNEDALESYRAQADVLRETRDAGLLVRSLDKQAAVLGDLERFEEADALLAEVVKLCRESGWTHGVAHGLHKRAVLKTFKMGNAAEGARRVEEALGLARKAGDEAQIRQIEETQEMIRRVKGR